MLMQSSPAEAYRKVDFDARIAGANKRELVLVCFEQLTRALDSALAADQRCDNQGKSAGLTRALAALTALQLGIDRESAVAPALLDLYEAARRALLDAAIGFDRTIIGSVKADFGEIAAALARV
jgi:flagellin-specific chaperone FliS